MFLVRCFFGVSSEYPFVLVPLSGVVVFFSELIVTSFFFVFSRMAGPGNNLVQVFATGRANHWEFLRLRTGFELSSSWTALPCYGLDLNRNILDFMRWPQIGLGAQDLNGIQRPKSFQKSSWK